MATSNVKLIGTVVVIAVLSVPLVLLVNQNASLRRELAAVGASTLETAPPSATNTGATQARPSSDESRRLRKEHLELLSLRGRVTQLANELRQRNAAGTQANANPNPTSEGKGADSILFTAALTNRVPSGNTLVVGGWSSEGKRDYLLATPAIEQGDGTPGARQVTVKSQVVGAPESFWDEIGWSSYKSDRRRSTLAGVLTSDELDSLLQALKETKDAGMSNTSLARRHDGEYIRDGVRQKRE